MLHYSGKLKLASFHTELTDSLFPPLLTPTVRKGNGNPLQYSCLENPMDRGAWEAAVHGVAKSWTRLSDFTFTFHFHALEKEMATQSSALAWRIPGTAEPGGLPSMGSQSWTRLKQLSSSSSNSHCTIYESMSPQRRRRITYRWEKIKYF